MLKERNKAIDMAKCFAIILMILGHCITNGSGADYRSGGLFIENPVYVYIYTFHMPLFMMISGYLFGKTINKKSWTQVLKSRFFNIFIPIIVWQLLYTSFKIVKTLMKDGFSDGVIWIARRYVMDMIHVYRSMWFLWAILICTLIVSVVHFVLKDHPVAAVVSVFATWCIPVSYIQLWVAFYPCFLIAYMFARRENNLEGFKRIAAKWYIPVLLIIVHILLLQIWDPRIYPYLGEKNITYLFNNGDILNNLYVNLLRITIGIVGASVWITIFNKVDKAGVIKNKGIYEIVMNISQWSMGFYVLSVYFLNDYLRNIDYLQPEVFLWISFTIAITVMCYIFFMIVDKIPRLKILLLGGR